MDKCCVCGKQPRIRSGLQTHPVWKHNESMLLLHIIRNTHGPHTHCRWSICETGVSEGFYKALLMIIYKNDGYIYKTIDLKLWIIHLETMQFMSKYFIYYKHTHTHIYMTVFDSFFLPVYSPTTGTQESRGMTFIDEHQGTVLLSQITDTLQRSHITIHGEHAVCDHQPQTRGLFRNKVNQPRNYKVLNYLRLHISNCWLK